MRSDRINNMAAGKVETEVSADGEHDIYKADLECTCEADVGVRKV